MSAPVPAPVRPAFKDLHPDTRAILRQFVRQAADRSVCFSLAVDERHANFLVPADFAAAVPAWNERLQGAAGIVRHAVRALALAYVDDLEAIEGIDVRAVLEDGAAPAPAPSPAPRRISGSGRFA